MLLTKDIQNLRTQKAWKKYYRKRYTRGFWKGDRVENTS